MLVQLNIRVIMDISKTRVCFGPTLVCRFNRYWIKTSGGIRVNTWTTIDFWSTAEKNIQTSKALLQNWQHFVDPQQLYNASCQLSIKGHPIIKGFFSIIPSDFAKNSYNINITTALLLHVYYRKRLLHFQISRFRSHDL